MPWYGKNLDGNLKVYFEHTLFWWLLGAVTGGAIMHTQTIPWLFGDAGFLGALTGAAIVIWATRSSINHQKRDRHLDDVKKGNVALQAILIDLIAANSGLHDLKTEIEKILEAGLIDPSQSDSVRHLQYSQVYRHEGNWPEPRFLEKAVDNIYLINPKLAKRAIGFFTQYEDKRRMPPYCVRNPKTARPMDFDLHSRIITNFQSEAERILESVKEEIEQRTRLTG